tara:strand:+ start:359 stop:556 length:198 start_codon:yes stop_codon:yes gene_type:complete
MNQEEKIKKFILGENKYKKIKEKKDNIIISKEEKSRIQNLINSTKFWDNFNLDLYIKIFKNDKSR